MGLGWGKEIPARRPQTNRHARLLALGNFNRTTSDKREKLNVCEKAFTSKEKIIKQRKTSSRVGLRKFRNFPQLCDFSSSFRGRSSADESVRSDWRLQEVVRVFRLPSRSKARSCPHPHEVHDACDHINHHYPCENRHSNKVIHVFHIRQLFLLF